MQKRSLALSVLLLLSGCPSDGSSGPTLPSSPSASPSTVPDGPRIEPASVSLFARGTYFVGAGTHLGSRRDLGFEAAPTRAALGRLGFNSYRDDVFWQAFAPRGDADTGSLLAKQAEGLSTIAERPLLVLNGGHTLVANASPPLDDQARAAFARFAVRAVAATSAKAPIYEIWNEWNRSAETNAAAFEDEGPPHDPRFAGNYAALAKAVVPAIRSAHPDATILVGGAATDWQWKWLMGAVRRGALAGADGLSVHLYNQCYPQLRGAGEMIARLDALHQQTRAFNGNRDVPIYVTEWGWSTGRACAASADFVIANSAQFLFAAAARPWVRGTWQYVLKDTARDSSAMEDTFGILDFDYRDKPTTCAVQDAVRVLRAVRTIGEAAPVDGVQVIYAQTATGYIAIAWDRPGGGKAVVVDGQTPATVTPVCGTAAPLGSDRRVPLSAVPVVIDLGQTLRGMTVVPVS
jgi:hypothetical protein